MNRKERRRLRALFGKAHQIATEGKRTKSDASLRVLETFADSPGKRWTESDLRALCLKSLQDSLEEDDVGRTVDDVILLLEVTAVMLDLLRKKPGEVWVEDELLTLEVLLTAQCRTKPRSAGEVIKLLEQTGLIPGKPVAH